MILTSGTTGGLGRRNTCSIGTNTVTVTRQVAARHTPAFTSRRFQKGA